MTTDDLKAVIRDFDGFPKEGIIFRDITTLLKNSEAFATALKLMEDRLNGLEFSGVIAPESRGFMFGPPIAYSMGKGFIPARKKGKLPGEVMTKTYALEYGEDAIELHKDAIVKGGKYVIVDDLLATGGTVKGMCEMVEELGGSVEAIVCLIELNFLQGREMLKGYNIQTILEY